MAAAGQRGIAVSAPGKLMVAGEYAVLRGAPALVTAVDRRLVLSVTRDESAEDASARHGRALASDRPEVARTRTLAEATWGFVSGSFTVDARALHHEGSGAKLGLGSSAAAAAATAAAVCIAGGQPFGAARSMDPVHGSAQAEPLRKAVLQLALAGHRAVAPAGSGADVAASVLGGWVRVQRCDQMPENAGGSLLTTQLAFPDGVFPYVVWTGHAARTSYFVARVEALRARDSALFDASIAAITRASEGMLAAIETRDASTLLEATRAHHKALAALGTAAAVPIVEERLTLIEKLAREAGGAAKPSGAGGGDVALVLFTEPKAPDWWSAACQKHGLVLLSLCLGAEGVREESLPPEPP